MPAVSKRQRRLAGVEFSKPGSTGMMGMALEDLRHYAGTKEGGLPVRKKGKGKKRGK
jgi:hypothetical protein